MKIQETSLPGVLLLKAAIYRDHRGAFRETWNLRAMEGAGMPEHWVQDNFSVSRKNVLRGIHYQVIQPQGKLVSVAYGAVLDLRGLAAQFALFRTACCCGTDGGERRDAVDPAGFGHAFLALTETVGFAYKVTDYYSAAGERTIRWDDEEIGIAWPVNQADVIVSERNGKGATLREAEVFP